MNALLLALSLAAAPQMNPSTNTQSPSSPPGGTTTAPTPPGTGMQNPPQYDALPGQLPQAKESDNDAFSVNKVVDKLHRVNEKTIEYGSLAQKRGSDDAIRKFGAKLVKDHQGLDKAVLSFAKSNSIQIGAATKDYGAMTGGAMGSSGSDFDSSGSVDRTGAYDRTGTTDRTGAQARSDTQPGTVSDGTPAIEGDQQAAKQQEQQAKLDDLANLQGSEFDSKFLSNIIDGAQRTTEKLTLWKGQDKKVDALIDRSLKLLSDHEKEARKLNTRVPAA